ncbi:MAG: lysine--tRNA ligase [Candidatus Spechtbacterales bacterium]
MATLKQIIEIRLKKRKLLKEQNREPYPIFTKTTRSSVSALADFSVLAKEKTNIALAGRVMSFRTHGGLSFSSLRDAAGSIQIAFRKDALGVSKYAELAELLDVGDFIEAKGVMFKTKRGEKTLDVSDFKIIAKSIRPLPEKWHGLKDVEQRYRKRYLDILMNEDARRIFETRSFIISELRSFMEKNGFMEVETPVLQNIPGGATAKPFKTHLNAFDLDMYLRISPELYLKRLLVGGFDKVYELGTCFRNEGVDYSHNPEFTMLEFYWAYSDYKKGMKFTEKLISSVVKKITGKKIYEHEGTKIDFSTPWNRIEFTELLQKYAGIKYEDYDLGGLAKKAQELGVEISKDAHSKPEVADAIYKKYCMSKIKDPVFVIHHPRSMLPLAKPLESNPEYAASFQLVVNGWELVKGYSELNDPVLQKEFFGEQEKLRKVGDEEAQHMDEDFVEALEYGMPPAFGFGMGVDRLTAFLTNSHALREVKLFPTMRPVSNNADDD